MRFCHLQQRPQPAHVVGRIHGGVRHTFSHGFVRGEVQDAGEWGVLRGMLLKHGRQGLTVAHVHLRKRHVGSTQGLHAFHSLKGGVVEVVQQNREESRLVQGHRRVAADVPGATSDQNGKTRCVAHATNLRLSGEDVTFLYENP